MGTQSFVDFIKPFTKSLAIESYSSGISRPTDDVTPDWTSRLEWHFTRNSDESSILLAQAVASGSDLGTVTVRFFNNDTLYLRVILPNASLTSYSGTTPEQFTIKCDKPTVFYASG